MPKFLKKKFIEQDVLSLGRERVSLAFDLHDHVAVSFSGGKDSTCVFQLALEEARRRGRVPLDVVFYDEEAIAPHTEEYVRRVASQPDVSLRWLCLPVKHRNACSRTSQWWYPWDPDHRDLWCRPLPPEAITSLAGHERHSIPETIGLLFKPEQGSVCFLMGLRSQESLRRYQSVAKRTNLNWLTRSSWIKAGHPIYDWRTEDVWTAPRKLGWDYNRAYDHMTMLGIPRHLQRVCPPYGEEPLQALWIYSVCWPELWERMVQRVPGAATGARYGASPLYSHRGHDGWDPEGDPRSQIEHALDNWPPQTAAQIRRRIANLVKRHYTVNDYGDAGAIPMEATEGLSWRFLYTIARRGDFKGRKQVTYRQ